MTPLGLSSLGICYPFAGKFLCFGDLSECHFLGENTAKLHSLFVAIRFCNVQPLVGLNGILRQACALSNNRNG